MVRALLLLALALPQGPVGPDARPVEDQAALEVFGKLSPAERKDLVDYFRAEAAYLKTFQGSLVAFVLGEADRDAKTWPEESAAPWFESSRHTPENDIPRHALEADSDVVKARARSIFAEAPAPRFVAGFRYDYGTRGLVRRKDWKDPQRIFRNGLAGAHPDLDLAAALVERALDDGAEQKALLAFGHAYTDRDGGAYPGITLYDAWGSGVEIETPDVDTLGIVHTVLDDWKTWHAPVPATQHDKLFEKVGGIFLGAQRHRALRHALATTYLEGSAVLGEAYQGYLDNLHALWEDCKSTPAALRQRLPATGKRDKFLASWTKRCREKPDLWDAALRRHRTLDEDGEMVRGLLLRLLAEFAPANGPGGKDR